MGLDRFANFITKSINNDGIEDINIDHNVKLILSSHIIFDLNFFIYQEISVIENEINDIIKIILCLPFSSNKIDILEKMIKNILTQKHWIQYYGDTENIFDGNDENEIITKFLEYINKKIRIRDNIEISILDLVIYEKIINSLYQYIVNLHNINYIQKIILCFDGIPSISKIFEQRRRRIKNYLESLEKKVLFKQYFNNLTEINKNIFDNLSKHMEINDSPIYFNYFKWLKNRYNINKSIGPSSDFIYNLELYLEIKMNIVFPKIEFDIISSKINGESDLKIFKYIIDKNIIGDYMIHTSDSDLIHQILLQQTYFKILNVDINLSVIKYIKKNIIIIFIIYI